jgi:hypothetical protein
LASPLSSIETACLKRANAARSAQANLEVLTVAVETELVFKPCVAFHFRERRVGLGMPMLMTVQGGHGRQGT